MFTGMGISTEDLKAKGRRLIRRDGKQILLIAQEGGLFAIANRCPHEGYPLSEGTLDVVARPGGEPLHTSPGRAPGPVCVLTCNWHNWKFDLQTGAALVGRDPVRTYPLEVREGEIFLDLGEPPAAAQRERALKGLEAAITDNDRPRMARETARLLRAGFAAEDALRHAIAVCNERLEDGMTHAHGAASGWLALADGATAAEQRMAAVLEPIAHLAWDTEGAAHFPYAEDVTPWDAAGFLTAVEGEREADAIAFVRGALAAGLSYADLQDAFGEAALAHYAGFGHSAIYAVHMAELLARLGPEVQLPLLLALTRSLVRATREERLPEFRFHAKALAAWDGADDAAIGAGDLVNCSVEGVLQRLLASAGQAPGVLFDALMGAAAWNMLHFDLSVDSAADNAIADNVSWLDFTHALTFASAVRQLCERQPKLWPQALLQLGLFVGRNVKYVRGNAEDERWQVDDPAAFLARETEALYDHGIVEPIIACHRLKMLRALDLELRAAPEAPWADAMCAGVNRYLNTPIKRHHGLRVAAQALDFAAKEA